MTLGCESHGDHIRDPSPSIDNPEGTTESHKADASTLKELHREVMERLRSDLNFTETLR